MAGREGRGGRGGRGSGTCMGEHEGRGYAARGRPVRDVGDVEKRRKLQAPMKAVDPKLRHKAAWNRMRAASSACSAVHRPELEFRGT